MVPKGDRLYQLLPAIYRIRDAERGEPLKGLLSVIAEQAAAMENDIAGLHENWFIETCAEWVVPYIGDLLGVRNLHPVSGATFSQRARVANTLSYRRRKGTASMLELLARDTTGWPARLVEFFQLLETTQYANHVRLENFRTPDLRQGNRLDLLDTPFDTIAHTVDVRHIDRNRGKHNIPNIGIFLWRLHAYPISQAAPFFHGDGRFSFSQLGQDAPLFNFPVTETDPSHLAEEVNLPAPIRRRALRAHPADYYGEGRSLRVMVGGVEKPMVACHLGDWEHRPKAGGVAVDPVLGRVAFPSGEAVDPEKVRVDYHYGFSSEVGGGCYGRGLAEVPRGVARYQVARSEPPLDSIRKAVQKWVEDGRPDAVIEIRDNGSYEETLNLLIPPDTALELRAAETRRPVVHLTSPLTIKGEEPSDPAMGGGRLTLDGLLVSGHAIEVLPGALEGLHLRHCTLLPGLSLNPDGEPGVPGAASLSVSPANSRLQVSFTRSISGRLNLSGVALTLLDTIVDGTDVGTAEGEAIRAGTLNVQECTVWGRVGAEIISLASNSIFMGPVTAERKQEGCVRFCYLAASSDVPRRYQCQPDIAIARALREALKLNPALSPEQRLALRQQTQSRVVPSFTSRRYGQPGYGQLHRVCAPEIQGGADDQGEMGVFHHLKQFQREANLRSSLSEYLRVGLEAGIVYVT